MAGVYINLKSMPKIKIAAIYRGKLMDNRGTPIRVKNLLSRIAKDEGVDLTIFSWDENLKYANHIYLSNNHLDDLKKIRSFVRKNNVDVVIGHTLGAAYYLVPLRFLTRAKIVLEMHGFNEEEAREYGDMGIFKFWLAKVWNAIVFFSCSLITTCSKSITDIIQKYNKNTVSIYGGVDLNNFNPYVKSGGYFKKDERLVIGYAGNARKWQGVDFLVNTFKEFSKKEKDYRLVMLMSETKGIDTTGLEIVGALSNDEVPKFLIDCDILVIPRPLTRVTKISYPSKLTEYMAMGKAVVSANVGDADQVIVHGENGFLFEPGNTAQFEKCLLDLRDRGLRERLGKAAFETASKMSWDNQSAELLAQVNKLL